MAKKDEPGYIFIASRLSLIPLCFDDESTKDETELPANWVINEYTLIVDTKLIVSMEFRKW